MQSSQSIQSISPISASPDGTYIAVLHDNQLDIRHLRKWQTIRSIPIESKGGIIKWSPASTSGALPRFFLQMGEKILVWDLEDQTWHSKLTSGSGGMGKIISAEFGRTKNELLVLNDFGSKLTIWSLISGRNVEIRDPKVTAHSYAYRPKSGHFALLSRPAAQDILTLHSLDSYAIIKTVQLQTLDAQGLKWSPDGRWLAIWDTPTHGTNIHFYTADGNHYRTYCASEKPEEEAVGIRSIFWSPDSRYVAIGGFDHCVTLLGTQSFSPVMFLEHSSVIDLDGRATVWHEEITAQGRTYAIVPQPVSPTTVINDKSQLLGVSSICFDASSTIIATRDDSAPTTVWLWNLTTLDVKSIIIHNSPIKKLSWHPTLPGLLLIQNESDSKLFLHLWDSAKPEPMVNFVPFTRSTGKIDMNWISSDDTKPELLINDDQRLIRVWPYGKPTVAPATPVVDEDQSFDSVYEALLGQSSGGADDDAVDRLDDTFMGRGQRNANVSERSEDCMF